MSIQISIPNTRCQAGSTISGTVSLHGDEDIDILHITITLQARCKTKVTKDNGENGSSTYRGRAPLIFIKRELFTGPHTLHPGHSWPFQFTLPLQCAARQADHYKPQRTRLFNSDSEQELPLSFAYSTYSSVWSADCFIRYELEASLIGSRRKIFLSSDLTATRLLDFITPRNVYAPDPQLTLKTQTVTCYSLHLQPGHEDVPLTFKEKLKSIRTSKLPVAVFRVHMQLPRVGFVGQPLPAFIQIDHDIERSTAQAPPKIFLKKCTFALEALTYVRCMRESLLQQVDDHEIASVDYSERIEKSPPLTEHLDLRDVMITSIPSHHKPFFSTFNIHRAYKLKLKISVECAHKVFKAEYHTQEFVLLARDYLATGEGVPGASTAVDSSEPAPIYQQGVEIGPPSYQEAKTG